eukprot:scaffold218156_cov30-Tisochrysis_lutea.AAC.2
MIRSCSAHLRDRCRSARSRRHRVCLLRPCARASVERLPRRAANIRAPSRATGRATVGRSAHFRPRAGQEVGVGGGGIDARIECAEAPFPLGGAPGRCRVPLRSLDNRVVRGLRPVGEELVARVVGGDRLRKQCACGAGRPVRPAAEARVDLHDAKTFASRPAALDHDRRAGVDGHVVVRSNFWRRYRDVEAVPYRHGHGRPVYKVFGDEVAIVGTMTR